MTRPARLVTAPGARYDRCFYAFAAVMAAIAVASAVGAAVVFGTPWYLAAVAFAAIAGYVASYPWARAAWYEAGYLAAIPTLPRYGPGSGGGHAVFASEALDGDPRQQAVMIAALGVNVRALLAVDGSYTDEWIVSIPLPPGARIVHAEIVEPIASPRPPGPLS
jgi:hypothetical protein